MSALFGKKFDGNKVKVNLKMSVNRFNLLTSKKANLAKQQKRQVALLLRDDKEANARILVEHIIREDYALESYELLKQYCELLLARLNVLTTEPDLKPEIAEAVCSLLYGGYLMGTDIPELKTLNTMFTAKYGQPYAQEVVANKEKYLNHRLLRMLTSTSVPDSSVTELYLTEIAKAYGVQFTPRPQGSIPAPINSSTLGVPLPLPGQALPPQPIGSDAGSGASGAIPPIVPPAGGLYPGAAPGPPQPKPPACGSGSASAPVAGVPVTPLSAGEQPSMDLTSLMGGGQPAAGGSMPLVVTLVKSTQGFGMTLDHNNVVLAVKPFSQAETSGVVQPGDRVVLLNNVPITADRPVKSVAIDLPDGAPATFHLVRDGASGSAGASALPPAPVGGGGDMLLDVQVPPPQGEVLPPSGPATNTLPARADGRVESEDDALARRLEMLKRG